MNLKKLVLKNFRMFEDQSFSFKPITIVAGPNGSGKSSLFKSLLLLKDSQERNDLSFLEFNDSAKHSLGRFSSIVTQKSGEAEKDRDRKEVIFELTIDQLEDRFEKTSFADITTIRVVYGFKKILVFPRNKNGTLDEDDAVLFQVDENEDDAVLSRFEIYAKKGKESEEMVFTLTDNCDNTKIIDFKVNVPLFLDALELGRGALIEQPIHNKIRLSETFDFKKLFNLEELREEIVSSSIKRFKKLRSQEEKTHEMYEGETRAKENYSQYKNKETREILLKNALKRLKEIEQQIEELEAKKKEKEELIDSLLKKEEEIQERKKEEKEKKGEIEQQIKELEAKKKEKEELIDSLLKEEEKIQTENEDIQRKVKDFDDQIEELDVEKEEIKDKIKELKKNEPILVDNDENKILIDNGVESDKKDELKKLRNDYRDEVEDMESLIYIENESDNLEEELKILLAGNGTSIVDERMDVLQKDLERILNKVINEKVDRAIKAIAEGKHTKILGDKFKKGENEFLSDYISVEKGEKKLDNWEIELYDTLPSTKLDFNTTLGEVLSKNEIKRLRILEEETVLKTRINAMYSIDKTDDILFYNITDILDRFFSIAKDPFNFIHFSTVRGIQKRIYNYSEQNYAIEAAIFDLANFTRIKGYKEKDEYKFLLASLELFEIGSDIRIRKLDGSSFQLEINIEKDNNKKGNWVALADLGFGISQLMPILIKTSLELSNSPLLLIEEPGANLHPGLQSRLAEFFIRAKDKRVGESKEENKGPAFVIESHSEYMLRRLQYEISKETIGANDVQLFHISLDEQNKVQEIEVSKYGDLIVEENSFWSEFFDEETTLEDRRAKVVLEKKNEELREELKTQHKVVIFTEDTDKSLLIALLLSCKFVKEEFLVISYNGHKKLKSAFSMAKLIIEEERYSNVEKIIIHQDADGVEDFRRLQYETVLGQFFDLDSIVNPGKQNVGKTKKYGDLLECFITQYNDVEGYFINHEHIHFLNKDLSYELIKERINSLVKNNYVIKDIKKKVNNNRNSAKVEYEQDKIIFERKNAKLNLQLDFDEINKEACETNEKYKYSKPFYTQLKKILLKDLQKSDWRNELKISLPSEFLKDENLEKIAKEIWPENQENEK